MDSLTYKNKIQVQKTFAERFENDIVPYLRGHEVLRKRLHLKYILVLWVPICILLVLWVVCWVWFFSLDALSSNFFLAFMLNILGFPLAFFIAYAVASKFNKGKEFALELKKSCLQKLISSFGDITWENNKGIINDTELNKSGLFPYFEMRTNDDEFYGSYNGIDFKLSETTLQKEVSSGNSRSYMNVFSGLIFEFTLKNPIANHTIVSTKGDLTSFSNTGLCLAAVAIALFEPALKSTKDGDFTFAIGAVAIFAFIVIATLLFEYFNSKNALMQKVNLEDVEFAKKFNVYSDNQVEARCVVTPSFMEKFLNLKTTYGAKKAKCAFYDNKLVFAIATKENLFEIGKINKPLLETETFRKIYDEIAAIYEIIDYFQGTTRKYIEREPAKVLLEKSDKLLKETEIGLKRIEFKMSILKLAIIALLVLILVVPALKHYYKENINVHKNVKRWSYSENPYINEVAPRIRKNWHPPKSSKSYSVVVLFKINLNGDLVSSEIRKSSGSRIADKAALDAIRNSAPFPRYIGNTKHSIIPIEYTFDYRVVGLKD